MALFRSRRPVTLNALRDMQSRREETEKTESFREVVAFGHGLAVVIDGAWVEEDGVHLRLEVYEQSGEDSPDDSPVCTSEDGVRDALMKLGAYPEQAAKTGGPRRARLG